MANRRTGLQSDISSIFSGVPVPKKERSESGPGGSAPKRPAPDPSRPRAPRKSAPRAKTPGTPTPPKRAENVTNTSPPRVREVKLSRKEIKSIPRATARTKKARLPSARAGDRPIRQKAEMILAICLLIVLLFVLARPFSAAVQDATALAHGGQTQTGLPAADDVKIDWPMPAAYPTDIRDPMVLDSQRQFYVEPEKLVVRGIVYSADSPFAIIGIRMMQEGEVIDGATILKINPDNVLFGKDGKEWEQEVEGHDE